MITKLNFNFKELPAKILPILQKVKRYMPIIFIIFLATTYGFLIFRINALSQAEPSDESVTEVLSTVKRPKVSQTDVDKLQQLQDNSVDVQTLFKHARDNPFQE